MLTPLERNGAILPSQTFVLGCLQTHAVDTASDKLGSHFQLVLHNREG